MYPEVASLSFLADNGDTFHISTSTYDVGPDTIFTMRGWADGTLEDTRTVQVEGAPIFLVVNYYPTPYELRLNLSVNQWNIGEVELGSITTMGWLQVITVSNTGNYAVQLGLQITREGSEWHAGYYNEHNTFVLRARFEEEDPGTFNGTRDFVKSSRITWATPTIFGPGGYNIPVCAIGDCEQYLWLQFLAPTSSTVFTRQVLGLTITARVPMP